MKNILFFLLLLLSASIKSQNIKVSYKQYQNYDYTAVIPLYLYINTLENTSALIQDIDKESMYLNDNEPSKSDYNASSDRTNPYDFILLDLDNKTIEIYEDFARKAYKVNDVFPEIKWQLVNEQKTINNIQVNKAVGTYRGNTWNVWYAPSIPYSFGPWKLNGLPGLILEAKDIAGNISFNAEKVEYNVACNDCVPPKNSYHKINLKEYLLLQDKFFNDVDFDLPRGTTVTIDKKSILTKELKFEFPINFSWETDKK